MVLEGNVIFLFWLKSCKFNVEIVLNREGWNFIDKNYKFNINDLDLGWLSSVIYI